MEWYPLKGDGRTLWGHPFFGDARLDAELASIAGVLWRAEGGRRYLALPYAAGSPFPLTALFCFAKIEPVQGRQCAVYCIDETGWPVI